MNKEVLSESVCHRHKAKPSSLKSRGVLGHAPPENKKNACSEINSGTYYVEFCVFV